MNKEQLIEAGFEVVSKPEGEFLVKKCKVEDMPYANEHMVDNSYIFGTSDAVTEVSPNGMVTLNIADAQYVEGPVSMDTEEGAALLQDAVEAGKKTARASFKP